jgi:hypothetical protein
MSANIEAFLVNIFTEYKKVRKKHEEKTWLTFKSWFKRIVSSDSEFSFLLSQEPKLLHSYKGWFLSDYMKLNGVESERDIERAISCLKSRKDRLAHRNAFLILFAGLIAIGSSIVAVLGEPALLPVNVFSCLVLVLERHSLNDNVAIAQELAYVLENSKNDLQQGNFYADKFPKG